MTTRTPILRALTLLLAAMQLASPAMSAIADAKIAARSGELVARVEATSSAGASAIHSPDCALCRYLSLAASIPCPALDVSVVIASAQPRICDQRDASRAIVFLPDGRAPPTA